MNGKKAKAMRKLAEVVFAKLPDYEFVDHIIPRQYMLIPAGPVILNNTQRIMKDCKRRRYKMLKKIYKRDKNGIRHQSTNESNG